MKIQQRRPFFRVAISNEDRLKEGGPSWNKCFRPWGRIAAIMLAALLISCTSLTPERVDVLADIAGQAAAQGAGEWLAKHPEQRQAFLIAVARLGAVLSTDNKGPQSLEDAAVEFLNGLPTSTLRGKDGEVYVTGDTNGPAALVVWDEGLKKGVEVRGAAAEPVVRKIHYGLRRALLPKPPMPPTGKLALPPGVVAREMEGGSGALVGPALLYTTNVISFNTNVNLAINMAVSNLLSPPSTFDVTLNEHGIQQVCVRWAASVPGSYIVQRSDTMTIWEGWASVTNAGVWTTLWPAPLPVGQWRVLRAR